MDLRRYDLNLLVTLEALLDEGGVTGAARRLNLSQSAVSAALDRLRDLFSDPLLVRVGNRMEATPFANRLQGPIKTALASVSLALTLPQKFDPAKARMHVRLGLSDYVGLMILPRLYGVLAREAPGISIEVIPKPSVEALTRLVAGDVDLATAVDPPESRDLFNSPLVDETFVCVMRPGHPLARGRLTPQRLLEYPHVVVTAHGASAGLVDRALAAGGLKPPNARERAGVRERLRAAGGERPGRDPARGDLAGAGGTVRPGAAQAAAGGARLHARDRVAPAHRPRPGAPLAARAPHRHRGTAGRSSTRSITVSSNIDWTEGSPSPRVARRDGAILPRKGHQDSTELRSTVGCVELGAPSRGPFFRGVRHGV